LLLANNAKYFCSGQPINGEQTNPNPIREHMRMDDKPIRKSWRCAAKLIRSNRMPVVCQHSFAKVIEGTP